MNGVTAETRQRNDEAREAEQRRRQEAERQRIIDEREEHERQIALEKDAGRVELAALLEGLSRTEQKQVRLHAYLHVLNNDRGMPANLQTQVDEKCKRLARYMIEGIV